MPLHSTYAHGHQSGQIVTMELTKLKKSENVTKVTMIWLIYTQNASKPVAAQLYSV